MREREVSGGSRGCEGGRMGCGLRCGVVVDCAMAGLGGGCMNVRFSYQMSVVVLAF